jgi:hypothetical protein
VLWTTSQEFPALLDRTCPVRELEPADLDSFGLRPRTTEPTCYALDRPVSQLVDPLRTPQSRPNVVGASTWKGVVGLVNNQRTCEVAAH